MDPVSPESLNPDPVCPERLDPDPVNIRPDPQPCLQVTYTLFIFVMIKSFLKKTYYKGVQKMR